MAPKVFVSHASEDKPRFVVKFAQRLRENGVDAWLDQWEMKPGDSLVDRIFEEGLKSAQAVVIVLSAVSVSKPWVREELNLSVVKRISRGLKIIPVVIDACEVPESLQATIWQRIDDLDHYDEAFQRILSAIFDTSARPPIGQPPERFGGSAPTLPTFTRTDERVLREIARHEIDLQDGFVTFDALQGSSDLTDVPPDELTESLEILAQKDVIHAECLGGAIAHVYLTTSGFRQYAESFVPGYKESLAQLGGLLVNEDVFENHELAKRLGKPVPFVNFLLDVLEDAQAITVAKYGSGLWEVAAVSPSLKRSLA